jgi:hypothetical protein
VSRALTPFDPPRSAAPTILMPDHSRPRPAPPDRDPPDRRRRIALVLAGIAVVIAVVIAVLAVRAGGDPVDPADDDAAVALEHGVRPLVGDRRRLDIVGERATPGRAGVWRRSGRPNPSISGPVGGRTETRHPRAVCCSSAVTSSST